MINDAGNPRKGFSDFVRKASRHFSQSREMLRRATLSAVQLFDLSPAFPELLNHAV